MVIGKLLRKEKRRRIRRKRLSPMVIIERGRKAAIAAADNEDTTEHCDGVEPPNFPQ